jgi:Zn-dependent protease
MADRLSPESLELLALLLPVLIGSMVLHELAHAWVAYRLGDPTAKLMGRLTANPIKHVDPMGTIMFVLSYLSFGFLFGWAKPVPVQPRYFQSPHRGMAIVAVAGPITNLLLAVPFAVILAHAPLQGELVITFVYLAFYTNILLAVFNMLPIPPLDGSRVVAAFMPRQMADSWAQLDRFGFLIIFGLILFFPPMFEMIRAVTEPIQRFIFAAVGG